MISTLQTKFGAGEGNCLQASLASVLEVPLDAVPDFVNEHNTLWFVALYEWLRDRGCGLLYFNGSELPGLLTDCYGIMGVSLDGCDEHHAVVVKYVLTDFTGHEWTCQAELVHDPSPFRIEIADVQWHLVLIPPFRNQEKP